MVRRPGGALPRQAPVSEPAASDERARLFVALDLPAAVRSELASWRERVLAGIGDLRLIDRGQLHATLCFLGWRALSEVGPIAAACEEACRCRAAQLALGSAAWLPRRRPRVLSVSLEDADGELRRLQHALSRALSAGGWYESERREYFPHVTVARVQHGARVGPLGLAAPRSVRFAGSQVTLYRSRLARAGARYEPLASVSIG